MSQPNKNQHRSIQYRVRSIRYRLKLVLGITVFISIILRLTAPGYRLFILGIVLILGVVVHIGVHLNFIRQIDPLHPIPIYLILVSHLAFFLTFVFQTDGADGPQVLVPILFWMEFTWNSPWVNTFGNIVSISFLILFLTWISLLLNNVPTQKHHRPTPGV